MNLPSDWRLSSAIADGDVAKMAAALKEGAASPGSDVLKLLLAMMAQSENYSLILMPTRTRGRQEDPLKSMTVRSLWLRSGIPPGVRAKLITLLDEGRVWVGVRRADRRGPRADRAFVSKQVLDGAKIEKYILKIAVDAASAAVKGKPAGLVVPVVVGAKMRAKGIALFLSGRARGSGQRYAMKALQALRDYKDEVKS